MIALPNDREAGNRELFMARRKRRGLTPEFKLEAGASCSPSRDAEG